VVGKYIKNRIQNRGINLLNAYCYVDTSPHMNLGHVTPFRVYSWLPPPSSFMNHILYLHNRIFVQHLLIGHAINSYLINKSFKRLKVPHLAFNLSYIALVLAI
jgi:hypothetical protein